MTRKLLIFSTLLFLSGCATQTPRPVGSVDWDKVDQHLTALSQPTKVYGDIQHRYEAKTGGDLWTFSGRQEFALDEANGDKERMLDYVRDVAAAAKQVELPPCKWWQIKGAKPKCR